MRDRVRPHRNRRHGKRRCARAGSARRREARWGTGMAVAAVGRLQRAHQVGRRRYQEFGRPARGHDYGRTLLEGLRRGLSLGASRHRWNGLHRVGPWNGSARANGSSSRDLRRIRARKDALIARARHFLLTLGLGLMVGAVLYRSAGAQVDTTRAKRDTSRARADTVRKDSTAIKIPARPTADSLLRDSLAKRDSTRPKPPVRDSIQPPFARAPMPVPLEIGRTLIFDRAALFASGAVTLQDLLDRIPGITGLRSGWLASPMMSSYMGDVRRVRVFFDGVEYDEVDQRTRGLLDLTEVPLWTLEELRIEWGATEVRVYTRTWRVERTTPYTRTDISTGDQQTNLYRGFFGKRFGGGEGIQFGAQQYGTTPPGRVSPSSDQISLLARLGWAKRGWSFDAFALRTSRNRGEIVPQPIRG